jgi:hypothetical protein
MEMVLLLFAGPKNNIKELCKLLRSFTNSYLLLLLRGRTIIDCLLILWILRVPVAEDAMIYVKINVVFLIQGSEQWEQQ